MSDLGRMLSAVEAERLLGIPAPTVRTWSHRRERTGLHPAGLDSLRRPLFWEADLLALRLGLSVRDEHGRRVIVDIEDVNLTRP